MKDLIDRAIQSAADSPCSDERTVVRLAALSPFDYDRIREQEASRLGIRVATLDAQVAIQRRQQLLDEEADELAEGIEPWPEPVEGNELASEMLAMFEQYTVLPAGGALTLALWCIGTYCFDAFRIFPKLCLNSPEKRCGKTTTLEVIGALVYRALLASNVTPAVIFRSIEVWQPSLLIDEADTFISGNEELRGIINSGHTRRTAFVLRVEEKGGQREPRKFSTWAPMAIAMIKSPPDTIRDRSIMIQLRRKRPDEVIKRLPFDLATDCIALRQKLKRWADDHGDRLRLLSPEIPRLGNDRAMDNWLPLLAIAEQLGGGWPSRARDIMVRMESTENAEDSLGQWLLRDIRQLFDEQNIRRMFSDELVDQLVKLEERPWSEWRQGQPITKNAMARMLKPFGIHSHLVRRQNEVKRGYRVTDFEDAFRRYLTDEADSSVTTLQASTDAASGHNENVTQPNHVTFSDIPILNAGAGCNVVTVEKGVPGK